MSPEDTSRTTSTTTAEPAPEEALPAGYEDYAGEVQVANGKMPHWFTRVPYVTMILALAYYAVIHVADPVNLIFAALFIIWLIYTPIAQKRGWFFISM